MTAFFSSIWNFVLHAFGWLVDVLLYIPEKLVDGAVHGFIDLFNTIPVCGCITQAGSIFGNLSPYVMWFASLMDWQFGLGSVLCVMLIRFLLRALPWVF